MIVSVLFKILVQNNFTLSYLRYPISPIYDYYIDATGLPVYLAAGEGHNWADGETDSSGVEHNESSTSVSGYEYTSKTVELDFNEEDGEHIFVKSNLKKRKVYIKDIKWVEALGDYVKVVTDEASLVVLSTMKAFEGELPEGKFLRIHKSYIVSLDKIDRFNSKSVEVGSFEIPLSRNKKTQLADALNNM